MQKKSRRDIYILIVIFSMLFVSYFILSENYIEDSELNYTTAIKNEISGLISSKRLDTFAISKDLAKNPDLVKVLQDKDYKKLYDKNFFKIPKEYFAYKNIRLHVVDKNGIQRYLSWSKKSLGTNILKDREDLAKLYKQPHALSTVSVGKFSISFKGISPIYDKEHHFLGIIESVTFFNSIVKKLSKHQIYSLVLINKKFKNQLKYSFSNIFIDGYNIANINPDKNVLDMLKEYGVKNFINIKTYKYLFKKGRMFDGYYVVCIPIYSLNHNVIGYYVAFVNDMFSLAKKEVLLHSIFILMAILFLIMLYLTYKEHITNLHLIKDLDSRVKKELQEKMALVYTDALTGAYKRLKFEEDKEKFKNTKSILLDIKNFGKINTAYGFDIGDKILKVCVKRIENILQRKIYRFSGDEFVFFSNNPKYDVKRIKNKFLKEPVSMNGKDISLRISFSFGVARSDLKQLPSKLSIAVSNAKKYPFSDFMYYRDKMKDNHFLEINSFLNEAIFEENDDCCIVPFFQGIVDNADKKIKKYEALARLKVKSKIYSPYLFLDVARSSGFMHEITKIMIEKSLKYLSKMDEDIEISINITEDDLATRQLKDILINTADKYAISYKRVTLEILEGITAVGAKNNIKQLTLLKNLGFKLAIDDFGVEYSNFERLSELDIDFVKIDGKYIKHLEDFKSYKITKAIADFAHSLDIKVVAEFVENKFIQDIVEKLSIEYSQGYYFSKPNRDINY